MRLNSEHAKSQLNLGYLIHQQGNRRGAFRGTGFELCSDAYGAIRANEGHYLTSWGQLGAGGDQGKSLSLTSGEDINLATGRNLIASLSERLSLFVQRAAIKLFAASGKVEVQAQSDNLELTAEKDLKITSTEGRVRIEASEPTCHLATGNAQGLRGGVKPPGTLSLMLAAL